MTLDETRTRLLRLQAERLDAREFGVPESSSCMTRLTAAIEAARVDYTRVAVVEIASLRRDLATPVAD